MPTTYQFIAEHPDWAGTDLSSLKKLTCGGSPVPSRVLEAYEAGDLTAAIAVIRHHIDDALVFTRRHIEAVGGEV